MTRAIHEISIDTRTIVDRLAASKPGEDVSYAELSKLIGRDVQGPGRSALNSARHIVMRDSHVVFGTIRDAGLKRLADVEIVKTGEATVTKIRRTAKRGIRTITSIADFEAMPNEAKIKHNTFASMFGAIAAMSKPASVKKIEGAVNTLSTGALPIGRTLEAFAK